MKTDGEYIRIMTDHGLVNCNSILIAARSVGMPLGPACALMDIESSGRNVYGHDKGGALSGFPKAVTEDNFWVFWWMVDDQGMPSNGVGPCQITSKALLQDMLNKGKKPWILTDNMSYGMQLLWGYRQTQPSWADAAGVYNGGPDWKTKPQAVDYAERFTMLLADWRGWLNG